MDIPTINDCWMQIGTDNNQQNIETANGRIKSGAKGIGSFALNRLGSKAIMYTHKDGQDAFSWKVNWNDFNAPGKRINEIMADLEVVPLATIQEKMSSVASHFSIELPDYETGTILNIQDLTDVWEVDSLNHLQGALQDLVPPFSMSNFEQYLYAIGVGQGMQRLMNEHDRLFPDAHVDIRKWSKESHDRWLVIDDTLYHCGHSLNANGGHKISAITRMGISPDDILSVVG